MTSGIVYAMSFHKMPLPCHPPIKVHQGLTDTVTLSLFKPGDGTVRKGKKLEMFQQQTPLPPKENNKQG